MPNTGHRRKNKFFPEKVLKIFTVGYLHIPALIETHVFTLEEFFLGIWVSVTHFPPPWWGYIFYRVSGERVWWKENIEKKLVIEKLFTYSFSTMKAHLVPNDNVNMMPRLSKSSGRLSKTLMVFRLVWSYTMFNILVGSVLMMTENDIECCIFHVTAASHRKLKLNFNIVCHHCLKTFFKEWERKNLPL